jgi:hypothetical protein
VIPTPPDRRCFYCREKGHFANVCPKPRNNYSQNQTTSATPNRNINNTPVNAKQNYARERVNHVAMEDAQETPDFVLGMFPVNDTTAIMLFDSGASHSFISAIYAEKHNVPVVMLKNRMIVSSPGGDMPARQVCPKVNLKIRGEVDFSANLIVLDSKGIDVILGMD